MIHTEVHIVHNTHEAALLETAGLPTLRPTPETCANCGAPVGCAEKFIPLAVVLNDKTDWRLCMTCASPSIQPRS